MAPCCDVERYRRHSGLSTSGGAGQLNPAFLQVAKAQNNTGGETDTLPDAQLSARPGIKNNDDLFFEEDNTAFDENNEVLINEDDISLDWNDDATMDSCIFHFAYRSRRPRGLGDGC